MFSNDELDVIQWSTILYLQQLKKEFEENKNLEIVDKIDLCNDILKKIEDMQEGN